MGEGLEQSTTVNPSCTHACHLQSERRHSVAASSCHSCVYLHPTFYIYDARRHAFYVQYFVKCIICASEFCVKLPRDV